MIFNQRSNYYLRLVLDLLLLNIIFVASAVLAQSFQILMARNYMFILLAVLNFIWYFTSNVNSFYEDNNLPSFSYQFNNILKNTFVQIITAILFIFIAKEDLFTRNFILIDAFLLIVFISIRIQLLKILFGKLSFRVNKVQNMLIVGSGEVARNFYNSTIRKQQAGYNFAGYLDDIATEPSQTELIGKIDDLEKIIILKVINEVVVALPIHEFARLDQIIKVCNRHAVRVHIIPDYFKFISKKFRISMFENLFSLIVIIFFLTWLVPLLAIIIKIFSHGPVFFVQMRIGMRNKIFKFYKFRTLITNEKVKSETYSPVMEGDPRITRIGRVLRRTNLDELPQFFNILKGDMSVVGPRPHFIPYNKVYSEI